MVFRKVSVINRFYWPAVVFRHIAARANPFGAQGRQSFLNRAGKIWIAPRPAGVINAYRFVHFDSTADGFGGCEFDFAHGHADVFVDLAREIRTSALGQLLAAVSVLDSSIAEGGRVEKFFRCDHTLIPRITEIR